jgi:hypothetical protein
MSPESEEGCSTPSEGSSASRHSFGMNTLSLPEDLDDAVMDVPPSPEYQDDFGLHDERSSEDGSTSSQSRHSYGLNSMALPEPQDRVLPAGHIPRVQGVLLAEKCGVSAPPPHMEGLVVDF